MNHQAYNNQEVHCQLTGKPINILNVPACLTTVLQNSYSSIAIATATSSLVIGNARVVRVYKLSVSITLLYVSESARVRPFSIYN